MESALYRTSYNGVAVYTYYSIFKKLSYIWVNDIVLFINSPSGVFAVDQLKPGQLHVTSAL